MKLSFSTGGWPFSLDEWMNQAKEMHYDGLEIAASSLPDFAETGAPFSPARLSETVRQLNEEALCISCITAENDWAKESVYDLIHLAHDLRAPFVALPMQLEEKEAEEMREKRESLRCKKRKRKKSEKQIG